MLRRLFLSLPLLVLLTACVLESAEPLVAEKEGARALASFGDTLVGYTKSETGEWKKGDDGSLSIKVEGNHYVVQVKGENDTMIVTFASLGGPWWGVQAKMGDEGYTYVLAKIENGELLLHENGCSDIQKVPGIEASVDFSGGDCKVKPGADWRAMFEVLKANPPPVSMMLKSEG